MLHIIWLIRIYRVIFQLQFSTNSCIKICLYSQLPGQAPTNPLICASLSQQLYYCVEATGKGQGMSRGCIDKFNPPGNILNVTSYLPKSIYLVENHNTILHRLTVAFPILCITNYWFIKREQLCSRETIWRDCDWGGIQMYLWHGPRVRAKNITPSQLIPGCGQVSYPCAFYELVQLPPLLSRGF